MTTTETTPAQQPGGLEIKTTVTISRTRISDLLCNALEGGSNYWYEIKEYGAPPRLDFMTSPGTVYRHLDYPLNEGGYLLFEATGDDGPDEINGTTQFRLDLDAIRRGLELMSEKQQPHFADFLAEEDDATTGDVFLQLCLFGELVYG